MNNVALSLFKRSKWEVIGLESGSGHISDAVCMNIYIAAFRKLEIKLV